MFAFGLESKEVIKGGDAIHAAQRDAQQRGYKPQRSLIQIPEAFLDGVQGFDQRVRFAAVAARRGLDDLPALIVSRRLNRTQVRLHKSD